MDAHVARFLGALKLALPYIREGGAGCATAAAGGGSW